MCLQQKPEARSRARESYHSHMGSAKVSAVGLGASTDRSRYGKGKYRVRGLPEPERREVRSTISTAMVQAAGEERMTVAPTVLHMVAAVG